jgi:POT family proton-dependent oligopeptide transporter
MLSKHPRGLVVLFFTEMWERFGFYTMSAIYVLYMQEQLGWGDVRKGDFWGWFLACVYFVPIFGGWLGDRILGHRNTIRLGAILMVGGYCALAASSREALGLFYLGLLLACSRRTSPYSSVACIRRAARSRTQRSTSSTWASIWVVCWVR